MLCQQNCSPKESSDRSMADIETFIRVLSSSCCWQCVVVVVVYIMCDEQVEIMSEQVNFISLLYRRHAAYMSTVITQDYDVFFSVV